MLLKIAYIKDALYRHRKSMTKYVLVGGSTFVLDLGLLILLREVFHVQVLLAATAAYWTSIVYNFLMNRTWTFETSAGIKRHAWAYGLLLLTNYLVTIGIIAVLGHFGLNYAIAKVLAVGFSISWTYIAYKKFIFV